MEQIKVNFSNVAILTSKSDPGVSVVDVRSSGAQAYFLLSNNTEIGPVTLPAGLRGMPGPDGAPGYRGLPGLSMTSIRQEGNSMYVLMSDDTEVGPIELPFVNGSNGKDGEKGESITSIRQDGGHLYFVLSDNSEVGPYLLPKGQIGADGVDGADGVSVTGVRQSGNDVYFSLSNGSELGPVTLELTGGSGTSEKVGDLKFSLLSPGEKYLKCKGQTILGSEYPELKSSKSVSVIGVGDLSGYSPAVGLTKTELDGKSIVAIEYFNGMTYLISDLPDGDYYKFANIDDDWIHGQFGHAAMTYKGGFKARTCSTETKLMFVSTSGLLVSMNTSDVITTATIHDSPIDLCSVTEVDNKIFVAVRDIESSRVKVFNSDDGLSFSSVAEYFSGDNESDVIGCFKLDDKVVLLSDLYLAVIEADNINSSWGFQAVKDAKEDGGRLIITSSNSAQFFENIQDSSTEYAPFDCEYLFVANDVVAVDNTYSVQIKKGSGYHWASSFFGFSLSDTRFFNTDDSIIAIEGNQIVYSIAAVETEEKIVIPNVYVDGASAYIRSKV